MYLMLLTSDKFLAIKNGLCALRTSLAQGPKKIYRKRSIWYP